MLKKGGKMAGPVLNSVEIESLEERRKACICLKCSLCHKKTEEGCNQCDFPETDKEKCVENCYENK